MRTRYIAHYDCSCNDALEWEDGTNFLRNPEVHPVVAATETDSDSNCFVVEAARFTDRRCPDEYNPFLCQFTCTGKILYHHINVQSTDRYRHDKNNET